MTHAQNQINKAVNYLQTIQQDFEDSLVWGKTNHNKLAVDLDIYDDSIVIFFDTDRETGFTVALNAEFDDNEVIKLEIAEIEIDNFDGQYLATDTDNQALLLECKRIIHDASYYNLDDDITTDFYSEVYATEAV